MQGLDSIIKKLLDRRPIPSDELIREMASAAQRSDPHDMPAIEAVAALDEVMDEIIAVPALALLPAWGPAGVDSVARHALDGPHASSAFSILGAIISGKSPAPRDAVFLPDDQGDLFDYPVSAELAAVALARTRAMLLETVADPVAKSRLLWSIASLGIVPSDTTARKSWFEFYIDLLVDSHLVVNHSMLKMFEDLLDSTPRKEEALQKFLTDHPVLLDPSITELRSKHQLGDDFITDFVVRRINDEYVLVEIENSTDRIFTKEGQFTSEVTKALSQVRDFQAWISGNIAYAEKKLPGIRRPEGVVVVGRQKDLSELDRVRLSEENFSRRGHTKIVTYDDLLAQARTVYGNLLSRPAVLRAKDQRTL